MRRSERLAEIYPRRHTHYFKHSNIEEREYFYCSKCKNLKCCNLCCSCNSVIYSQIEDFDSEDDLELDCDSSDSNDSENSNIEFENENEKSNNINNNKISNIFNSNIIKLFNYLIG